MKSQKKTCHSGRKRTKSQKRRARRFADNAPRDLVTTSLVYFDHDTEGRAGEQDQDRAGEQDQGRAGEQDQGRVGEQDQRRRPIIEHVRTCYF